MFKMKYFVLATLICASTTAGQEKTKKNFVQRHKVLTGIAAGTLTAAGAFVAVCLYKQRNDKASLSEKLWLTAMQASELSQKAGRQAYNKASDFSKNIFAKKSVLPSAPSNLDQVKNFFGILNVKDATKVTVALSTTDAGRPTVAFVPVVDVPALDVVSDSETF